jgi:hypothetical protein
MAVIAKFLTPREMAVRLGVSVHLVCSTLEDLADVPPCGFADSTPVYDEAAFARVKHALNLLQTSEGECDE